MMNFKLGDSLKLPIHLGCIYLGTKLGTLRRKNSFTYLSRFSIPKKFEIFFTIKTNVVFQIKD